MSTLMYTVVLPTGASGGRWTLFPKNAFTVPRLGIGIAFSASGVIGADGRLLNPAGTAPPSIILPASGDPIGSDAVLQVEYLIGSAYTTGLALVFPFQESSAGVVDVALLAAMGRPHIIEPGQVANVLASVEALQDAQTLAAVTLGLIPPAVNAAQSAADAALSAAALTNIVPVANEAARINFFSTSSGNVACRQLDTLHVWSRYNGVIEDLGPWSLVTFNYLKEVRRLLSTASLLRPFELTSQPRASRRPMITIIFDDGYIQDLTVGKPLLDARNAKAAFAITTGFLNSGANFMTTAQIVQLQAEGHTILSHSLNHKDQTTYGTDLAGLDNDLKTSKTLLQAMGLNIDHYVYPYTNTNAQVREYVRKYYRSAVGIGREVSVPPLRQYAIKRMQVTSATTLSELTTWADQVKAANGWGVMLVHSGYDFGPTVQGYFAQFMDYAISIGVPFLSYDDGFATFGNQVELGDYTGGYGTVVDRSGVFWSDQAGAYLRFPLNTFDGTMGRTLFPDNKVSECAFSSVSNAGLPCSSGSLTTDRTIGGDTYGYNQWNRQQVFDFNSDNCWQRRALTDTTWTPWVLVSNAYPAAVNLGYNAQSGLTPLSGFLSGALTIFPFNNGGNGTDKGYPSGYYAGTLLTYRTQAGGGWDYQVVKKYNDTESQMRTTDGNGNWGNWVKITPTPLAYSFTGNYSAGAVAANGSADIVISGVPNVYQGDLVTASRANKLFGGLYVGQVGCYTNGTITITIRNGTSGSVTDDTQQWKIGVIR